MVAGGMDKLALAVDRLDRLKFPSDISFEREGKALAAAIRPATRESRESYASRIWAAGGVAELHVWPGGFHGFDALFPTAPLSIIVRKNMSPTGASFGSLVPPVEGGTSAGAGSALSTSGTSADRSRLASLARRRFTVMVSATELSANKEKYASLPSGEKTGSHGLPLTANSAIGVNGGVLVRSKIMTVFEISPPTISRWRRRCR